MTSTSRAAARRDPMMRGSHPVTLGSTRGPMRHLSPTPPHSAPCASRLSPRASRLSPRASPLSPSGSTRGPTFQG